MTESNDFQVMSERGNTGEGKTQDSGLGVDIRGTALMLIV